MLADETGVVPSALKNKPELNTFEINVWNAFARLSSRRTMGGFGAVGSIPYVEISAYLDLIHFIADDDDRKVFIDLIDFLDNKFLREHATAQSNEAKKRPK